MKKQKRHLAGQWQRFTRFIPETAPEGVRKAMRVAFLSGAYAIVEKALDQGNLEDLRKFMLEIHAEVQRIPTEVRSLMESD
jgi:predicted nuclease of restriction endonuclease-like (RecB) superfamily